MRRPGKLLVAALAAAATLAAGRWAVSLFRSSEFVHFSANFPTVPGSVVLARADLGGPWARVADADWPGYPPGGLVAWGTEGQVLVDIGRAGLLKRGLQPWVLSLSTHWIRNVGPRSRRVRLDLDACGLPSRWETFEGAWDARARESTRAIPPGGTFSMDWVLEVPEARRGDALLCAGGLSIRDADSGDLLTFLPIRIANGRAGEGER